jgi:hypothetical protein
MPSYSSIGRITASSRLLRESTMRPFRLASFSTSPNRFDALEEETISSLRYAVSIVRPPIYVTVNRTHNSTENQPPS